MSFDPALSTALDRVRFAVGDIVPTAELMPDATYDAVLAGVNNDETRATITMADALVSRYAQEPDKVTADGVTVSYKDRLVAWRALLGQLRGTAASGSTGVNVRGPRRADREGSGGEYRRDGPCDRW